MNVCVDATGVTIFPPGDDLGAGSDDDVDVRLNIGIAGLPMAAIRPSLMARSAFTIPQ